MSRGPGFKSALLVRSTRAVQTLLGEWASRGRPHEVAWDLLCVVATDNAELVARAGVRAELQRGLERLAARGQAAAGRPFQVPLGQAAPLAAVGQARGLVARLLDEDWGRGVATAVLAKALLAAALNEACRRYGPAGAAALAGQCLQWTAR